MKSRAFVNHPVSVEESAFSSVANVRCCPPKPAAVTRSLPVPRWMPSIPLERIRFASIECPREVPARVAPATSTP